MAATAVGTGKAGIVLPTAILLGLIALIGVQADLVRLPSFRGWMIGPEAVRVEPRPFDYRASGEFIHGGASVDGPLIHVEQPAPLEIMKYQVSAGDYAACIADGACQGGYAAPAG